MCSVRYETGIIVAILLVGLSVCPVRAQDDVEAALSTIGQRYADNYVQPFTDALGAGLHSGMFRTAKVGGGGILPAVDLYVGVSAMGVSIGEPEDSFRLPSEQVTVEGTQGPFEERSLLIDYPDRDLPAAFGNSESPGTAEVIDVTDPNNPQTVGSVRLPGSLLDTPLAPTFVPQVGIGTVFATDVQVRFLPEVDINDYGSVSLTGVAVRHGISDYIPALPVDVALQGSWQQVDLSGPQQDDIIEGTGWAANAQISKSFAIVTLYGGVQYETFDADIQYRFTAPTGEETTLRLDQDASNDIRGLAGVSLSLAMFRLNVDYALSANNVVTAGIGLTL